MSDESLDELIAMYRKCAREAPAAHVDVHILLVAESTRNARRIALQWPWLMTAMAASLMLWLAFHNVLLGPRASVIVANDRTTPPGYLEGKSRAYLLRMDVSPPPSPVAQYLLTAPQSPR